MSDLTSFARETESRVRMPAFETLLARHHRERRRHALLASAAAVAAVLAVALAVAALGHGPASRVPSAPAPVLTSVAVPGWSAEQIVGHPDAFVLLQLESRSDPSIVLTKWKRCVVPVADHDCLGREAMAVVDGTGHQLLVLGAVTGSGNQPSQGDSGLLREVGDGVWFWAHRQPGPYLLSPVMRQPVQLIITGDPVPPRYGTPAIECADGVGLCTLDVNARTLERLALPDLGGIRWAVPTARGCGLWGLAGAGNDLRLVIQQRDGSFATASLSQHASMTSLAEGGTSCEVAVYQGMPNEQTQVVVTLDNGATWQVHRAPLPQVAGLVETVPHLRVLLPPRWAALPAITSSLGLPGPLTPL